MTINYIINSNTNTTLIIKQHMVQKWLDIDTTL